MRKTGEAWDEMEKNTGKTPSIWSSVFPILGKNFFNFLITVKVLPQISSTMIFEPLECCNCVCRKQIFRCNNEMNEKVSKFQGQFCLFPGNAANRTRSRLHGQRCWGLALSPFFPFFYLHHSSVWTPTEAKLFLVVSAVTLLYLITPEAF